MRVAYRLTYIKVKACSYNEIFIKMLWLTLEPGTLVIKDFYKNNPCKEFLIPEDYWQINFDMCYIGEYDIIE